MPGAEKAAAAEIGVRVGVGSVSLSPNCQPTPPLPPPPPPPAPPVPPLPAGFGRRAGPVSGSAAGCSGGAGARRVSGAAGPNARGSGKAEAVARARGPEPGAGSGGGALEGVRERLGSLSRGAFRGASDLSTAGKASVGAPRRFPASGRRAPGASLAGGTRERPAFAPNPLPWGALADSRAYKEGQLSHNKWARVVAAFGQTYLLRNEMERPKPLPALGHGQVANSSFVKKLCLPLLQIPFDGLQMWPSCLVTFTK